MSLRNLTPICARIGLITCVLFAASAARAQSLHMAQVTLAGYVGDDLKVMVKIPCGGTFYGMVAQAKQNNKRLEVAALIKRSSFYCASLPDIHTEVLRYIPTRSFKVIAPMKVKARKRNLRMAQVVDLRRQKAVDGNQLWSVYETKCGATIGTAIRDAGKDGIQVGILESIVPGQKRNDCLAQRIRRKIVSINTKGSYKIAPIHYKKRNIQRQYQLRLASIKPQSIKRRKKGGVSFQYKRKCNEAPVGMVLTNAKRNKRVGLGILVARYYNHKCDTAEITEYFVSKKGRIPTGYKIKPMQRPSKDTLIVKTPSGLSVVSSNRKSASVRRGVKGIKVGYYRDCFPTLGTIFAEDSKGNLAVGLLKKYSQKSCGRNLVGVSLTQPYVVSGIEKSDLFPMRIRGQAH